MATRVPGLPELVVSDPRTEEYRLLEAIGSWLASASSAPGMLLVVDDLHWAGKPTLLALSHLIDVASEDPGARLLVVGTYRDSDIDRTHPLGNLLGRLAERGRTDRYVLGGLTADDVVELVEVASGSVLGVAVGQLARRVYDETEGNPFFVGEVLRHLLETGAVRQHDDEWVIDDMDRISVPPSVRDVVHRRLANLPADVSAALSRAAVIGRDFDLEVLVALDPKTDEDDLVEAIERAVAARLVEELGPGRFRFAHALVQEAIYGEITETRRQRLHRRVVEALEENRPDDVVALAQHCDAAGADAVGKERTVRYLLTAGHHAQAARALADAESRFRRALVITEGEPALTPMAVEALIGFGECQRDQGDAGYRATLIEAAHRADDNVDRLVAALLANRRSLTTIVGEVDDERVALAERALDMLGGSDTAARAQLLAYLASEIVFVGEHERRLSLVDEAEAIARRIGDRRLLAEAARAHRVPRDRPRAHRCLGQPRPGGSRARRRDRRPGAPGRGSQHAGLGLADLGEVQAAAAINREAAVIADHAGTPTLRWMSRYWLLAHVAVTGDFAEATRVNDALLETAQAIGEPDGLNWWGAAQTSHALLTGAVGDFAEVIGQFADLYPMLPTWRAAHAEALAERGSRDESRTVLHAHPIDVEALAHDPYGLVGLASLAHVAWLINDAALGQRVYDVLAPHTRRWSHLFIGITGPVSWAAGRCLLAAGRSDDGIALFRAAVADAEAQGCPAVAVRAGVDLAVALGARDAGADRSEAIEIAQSSIARASAWAVDPLTALARGVLADLETSAAAG